jgi:hypothetical protein
MAAGVMWGTVITMMHMNVYCVKKQNGGKMASDLDKFTEYTTALCKDPEKLKEFYRKIMGPPHRDLEGDEYNNVKLILALLEPYKQTNNQHCWTDYYKVGDVEYHVTSWSGNEPSTIAEYLPE